MPLFQYEVKMSLLESSHQRLSYSGATAQSNMRENRKINSNLRAEKIVNLMYCRMKCSKNKIKKRALTRTSRNHQKNKDKNIDDRLHHIELL